MITIFSDNLSVYNKDEKVITSTRSTVSNININSNIKNKNNKGYIYYPFDSIFIDSAGLRIAKNEFIYKIYHYKDTTNSASVDHDLEFMEELLDTINNAISDQNNYDYFIKIENGKFYTYKKDKETGTMID